MASYFGAHSITFRARRPHAWETAAPDDRAELRRFLGHSARQSAGVEGALAAGAACLGAPALVWAIAALGVTALTDHATRILCPSPSSP